MGWNGREHNRPLKGKYYCNLQRQILLYPSKADMKSGFVEKRRDAGYDRSRIFFCWDYVV